MWIQGLFFIHSSFLGNIVRNICVVFNCILNNPVVNYLAKSHYRWNQQADVVVRMPCGAGVAAGPFHSQTNEAWFTKTPGLKVVYPAFPYDAKGLLATAINDTEPIQYFEHK